MKNIPAWPKIRWSLDRDKLIDGLILRGDTLWEKQRLAVDQAIGLSELRAIQLPFWIMRRRMMNTIRAMFARYIDRKVA